jgi:hypothetical protein
MTTELKKARKYLLVFFGGGVSTIGVIYSNVTFFFSE